MFILTDGSVSEPWKVNGEAKILAEKARVFTFGLGDDCDRYLVDTTARFGRGTSTIVSDSNQDDLKG